MDNEISIKCDCTDCSGSRQFGPCLNELNKNITNIHTIKKTTHNTTQIIRKRNKSIDKT